MISFADLPTPNSQSAKISDGLSGTYSLDKSANGNYTTTETSSIYTITSIPPLESSAKEKVEPERAVVALKKRKSLWSLPEGHLARTIWWYYTWPIRCILTLAIPNPKTWRRLYPLTFLMCVIFIGINSYMIVWMITVMGSLLLS